MAQELLQFSLAIIPAITISLMINKLNLSPKNKKQLSERALLLRAFARDARSVKSIMARTLRQVNCNQTCSMPKINLVNWKKLKRDERLRKYQDEPIFQTMIKQFSEWERI